MRIGLTAKSGLMALQITLLNHASVCIKDGDFSLSTDPWFSGSAFDGGWDLLFATPNQSEAILRNSQYIWISHEYPDHFSPSTLRIIEKMNRDQVTVLYQKSDDQKVRNWCLSNNFRFRELAFSSWAILDDTNLAQVLIGSVPFDDSWMALKIGSITILNTNDCVLSPAKLQKIKNQLGKVDVLLTQFSYANYRGNEDQKHLRELAADEAFSKLQSQVSILDPLAVITFASGIYFSAFDNAYMNDSVNSLPYIISKLEDLGVNVVGLVPGQAWNLGETHSNQIAIDKWNSIEASENPIKSFPSCTLQEIDNSADLFVTRLKFKNNRFLMRLLCRLQIVPDVIFFVSDLGEFLTFSIISGMRPISSTAYDVKIHSSALNFLLTNEYGIDTLLVNGRFQIGEGSLSRIIRCFGIGKLNNTGRILGLRLLFDFRYGFAIFRKLLTIISHN